MLILSDFLCCLAHGANDVGNAISPLIKVYQKNEPVDAKNWHCFLLGSSAIALGLMIYGTKVMKTIGENLIHLDYMKGFSL